MVRWTCTYTKNGLCFYQQLAETSTSAARKAKVSTTITSTMLYVHQHPIFGISKKQNLLTTLIIRTNVNILLKFALCLDF